MTLSFRGFFALSLTTCLIALSACSTTSETANMSDQSGASRVDSILDRAAREAKASGNKVEALALVEQIYNRNKDDAALATGFAQALREDNQLNRARQIVYPFTEGEKAFPDAVTELAMIQLALGQYKEAELTARRAIELDPDQGRPFLALGTALDAQNYHEQAEVAFRRGLDKWKGDAAPILNNLALNLASQNKLDQAVAILEKAKEEFPGRLEIERNLRIISTLREGADDFIIKQEQEKKAAAAEAANKPKPSTPAKPATKPVISIDATKPKTPASAAQTSSSKSSEDKAAQSASKNIPAAGEETKKEDATKPKAIAPSMAAPQDGNKQNFNQRKTTDE